MKRILTILGLTLLSCVGMQGAVTLAWNFDDDNATVDSGTPAYFSITDITIGNSNGTVADPVNSAVLSSGYTGASGGGNIGNAFKTGSLNTGAGGSGYFEFTIDPDPGYTFSITNFDFGSRSTSTGPLFFLLRSSEDSYATTIFSVGVPADANWGYRDNTFTFTSSTPDSPVTFRLYGRAGAGSPTAGTINARLDDITMTVTTIIPEPSTYVLVSLALLGLLVLCRKQGQADRT